MNKIYFFILAGVLCLISLNLPAQVYDSYDISKYYTPDITRSRLDLDFSLGGNYSFRDNNGISSYPNINGLSETDLNGNLYSVFDFYTSTRSKYSNMNASLNLKGEYKNEEEYNYTDEKKIKNISLYSSNTLNINYINRIYTPGKKLFWSYGGYGYLSYDIKDNDQKAVQQPNTSNYQYFTTNIRPYGGIGLGRIENVTEARQAVYILNALDKRNVLSRQLGQDEIFELAQIMSEVKNKRFLDSRVKMISEIETIDNYFKEKDLLESKDAAYFTTLYDYWMNGSLFYRGSGSQFEVILNPYYNHYLTKSNYNTTNSSNSDSKYKGNTIGGEINISYLYEKPFKLNWQHTVRGVIGENISKDYNKRLEPWEENYETTYLKSFVNLSYTLGYYPTTRTHLNLGVIQQLNLNHYKYDADEDDEEWTNRFMSYTNLNFNAYYYVSPQLRLSGHITAYENYQKDKDRDDPYSHFNLSFNFKISYAFF